MSTEAPLTQPKKKRRLRCWMGIAVLVLINLIVYQRYGPSTQVRVSPQTTYITEPLDDNGLPAYERYLLKRARAGVTPETNAAALLWPAMWPGGLKPEQFEMIAAELGCEDVPSQKDALLPITTDLNRERITDWLSRLTGAPQEARSDDESENEDQQRRMLDQYAPQVETILEAAYTRPWSSDQIPPLGSWISDNAKPLDQIVAASRLPKFYPPSPSLVDNTPGMVLWVELPGVQMTRDAARSLAARAMWHVGEERLGDAWQDSMALRRLARLVGQGPTIIDQLVAIAIDGVAHDTTIAVLGSKQLPPELAKTARLELNQLGPPASMANAFDVGERLQMLDAVLYLRLYGPQALADGAINLPPSASVKWLSIDWNQVLMDINRWCDRLVAAASKKKFADRSAALTMLGNDLDQLSQSVSGPTSWARAQLSRRWRSDYLGGMIVSLMMPASSAACQAVDRSIIFLDLSQIAASLAEYRAVHGVYPQKLEDLVPSVYEQLPVDLFHDKPFVYKPDSDGYLLYSTGANGQDDGGSNENMEIFQGRKLKGLLPEERLSERDKIPSGADDYSIRMPLPAFEMPKIPKPESFVE